MLDFATALQQQINADNFEKIDQITEKQIDLILLKTRYDRNFSILATSGLSQYKMPFSEAENNEPFIELCFALPSYWDNTFQSENSKWVLEKLKFLCNFVLGRNTHFWDGHTMPNAKPNKPFSETMKQEYLFFSKSILYTDQLSQVMLEEKTIHLLFLIPIFQKEFEHKLSRGTMALKKKIVNINAGEILDDFRTTAITKRFGLF
jgi:hypothetical protein